MVMDMTAGDGHQAPQPVTPPITVQPGELQVAPNAAAPDLTRPASLLPGVPIPFSPAPAPLPASPSPSPSTAEVGNGSSPLMTGIRLGFVAVVIGVAVLLVVLGLPAVAAIELIAAAGVAGVAIVRQLG